MTYSCRDDTQIVNGNVLGFIFEVLNNTIPFSKFFPFLNGSLSSYHRSHVLKFAFDIYDFIANNKKSVFNLNDLNKRIQIIFIITDI